MTDTEPTELLARIARQDQSAFTAFYSRFEKPVFRFVAAKMNDPSEAHDICHEVFMTVWRQASRFEGRSAVRTWLFGIAYRKTMDHFRKNGRVSFTDQVPDVADDSADALTCLAHAQDAEQLHHCLGTLKPDMRMAIELAFFEDMTCGDIASVADTAEGTVKSRIHHAKKLLLHCLGARVDRRLA